eukprot:6182399-Pleurochrysis_carterae.AAC.1
MEARLEASHFLHRNDASQHTGESCRHAQSQRLACGCSSSTQPRTLASAASLLPTYPASSRLKAISSSSVGCEPPFF